MTPVSEAEAKKAKRAERITRAEVAEEEPHDTPEDCADDVLTLLEGHQQPMTAEVLAEAFKGMQGTFRAWEWGTIRVACGRLLRSGELTVYHDAFALAEWPAEAWR